MTSKTSATPKLSGDAHIEIDEADFLWDEEPVERTGTRTRESLPTVPDHDPLRHDASCEDGERPREALPTLPDLDPLRHDR